MAWPRSCSMSCVAAPAGLGLFDGDGDLFHQHRVAVDVDVPGLLHRAFGVGDDVLDLAGEDHHAADLQHVVAAADDAADLGHAVAAAGAVVGLLGQLHQVAGAPAHHRAALAVERGDHHFADLARRDRAQRRRVDDLGDDGVLVDQVHLVAVVRIRAGDADDGAAGLGGAVDVLRAESRRHLGFELVAESGRDRLPAEHADAQLPCRARVDALRLGLVDQGHQPQGRERAGGELVVAQPFQHQVAAPRPDGKFTAP
jgi:hypothetical protein